MSKTKDRQAAGKNKKSKDENRVYVSVGEIENLIEEYQVPYEFDEKTLKQAEQLPQTVRAQDRKGRRDLRTLSMVTIDGADAKDLDDAVSLEVLENGHYLLGVHIADVTHYVKENSPLDREALKRGTSIYLADRVIPMLPQKLSNGICSLNAKSDRLALSCFMTIDEKGNVVDHEIVKSVICIDHRMTYEVVNKLLTEETTLRQQYSDYMNFFRNLEKLRNILFEKRIKRGAVVFDVTESKIVLDEQGKAVDICPEERNLATSIIEEAMLICNETVAEEYFWRQLPFVFRSHEEPDPVKIEKLSQFVRYLGFGLSKKGSSKSIQRLLLSLENTPQADMISRAVLRSMQQANYTSKNLGHYGLAAKYYCHFTSPIRRYPDLQIHRIIKEGIEKHFEPERIEYLQAIMPEICKQSSLTERRAVDLERAVESVKKAEYMADKLEQEFEGVISGVVSWGLYVELLNTIEGLVPIRTLGDDFYVLDQKRSCFVGRHNKKEYYLGDPVKVRLIKADTKSGNLDFVFV